jgi:NAD(P)-dependent dehydrogenase (short-subunit alcohol dehydrogenase family)
VTTITAAQADNPFVGTPASIPMITKGGLNAITLSLANEYAKNKIRVNAVVSRRMTAQWNAVTPQPTLATIGLSRRWGTQIIGWPRRRGLAVRRRRSACPSTQTS